ncbi:SLOG cluster 4 domain-containing protein [Streptomyces lasiicapitis]|uniref:SLOG cluster 4 domain-containing protein n=1 Tax=Streptomyces lasiicapitis TaxID=1923961 RepID=UPI00365F31E5
MNRPSPVEGTPSTAVFFGGVVPASADEERLAEEIGKALGAAGFALLHGGYNGLMEAAARGAAAQGGKVTAVTLAAKHDEWGDFNPHVSEAIRCKTLGSRLNHYFDRADLIVAMGGGVGTLHELTSAIYYAGNVRRVPVWIAGASALGLLAFLKREKWLFETPTRPLDFLTPVMSSAAFAGRLHRLNGAREADA